MILVLRGIDHRHLALAERVVERVVDLGDIEPEACGSRPVDDQVALQPLLLLIEVDLGQQRHLFQRRFELGGPLVDQLGIVGLEGVLVRRVGRASADADILGALQKQPCAGDPVELGAKPGHDLRHPHPLGQRFQHDEHKPGIGLAAAGERVDVLHRRILPNDIDQLGQLFLHQLEGDALVGLDAADHHVRRPASGKSPCAPSRRDSRPGTASPTGSA